MALEWYENPQRWPWDLYDNPIRVYIDVVSISMAIFILITIFINFVWFMYFKDYKARDHSKTKPQESPFSASITEISIVDTSQNQLSMPKVAKVRKTADIHIIAKLLSTLCIIFAIIFLCSVLMIVVFAVNGHHAKCIYISFYYEIIFIQRLCVYLYYLFRVYLTTRDSAFAFSERKLICMSSLMCIAWILSGMFYILYMSVFNKCTALSIIIGIIPGAVFEGVASIGCLLFFLGKLRQLLVKTTHQPSIAMLQYILSKITILESVTMITSFTIFSFFPFTFVQGLWAIDCVINVLCLILSFKFYDEKYKSWCMLCRRCCERNKETSIDPRL